MSHIPKEIEPYIEAERQAGNKVMWDRPTNWQEACVLFFPHDPFPRTAEEIRAKLLTHVGKWPDSESKAKNIEQIKAFTEEDLAGSLSDDGRLALIAHLATATLWPNCHQELVVENGQYQGTKK